MTARQARKLIEADGWYLKEQKGSHMQFIHNVKPGKVTIPFHGNDELAIFVVKNIKKMAGLK